MRSEASPPPYTLTPRRRMLAQRSGSSARTCCSATAPGETHYYTRHTTGPGSSHTHRYPATKRQPRTVIVRTFIEDFQIHTPTFRSTDPPNSLHRGVTATPVSRTTSGAHTPTIDWHPWACITAQRNSLDLRRRISMPHHCSASAQHSCRQHHRQLQRALRHTIQGPQYALTLTEQQSIHIPAGHMLPEKCTPHT